MKKNDKAEELLKELMELSEKIAPNPGEMLLAVMYFLVYLVDSQSKSEKNAIAMLDFTTFEAKRLLLDFQRKKK